SRQSGWTTVTVVIGNRPPVANADTKSTNEDTPLSFPASDLTANDTDPDGDTLTVTAVTATASTHGTGSLSGRTRTYAPAANCNGPASFSYTLSDGHGNLVTGTVSVTVNPVNDAPVLGGVPSSVTIPEEQPYTFTATASDPDGPAPTYSLVGAPAGA